MKIPRRARVALEPTQFLMDQLMQVYSTGFIWVLKNLESPGILLWHFPGLESPGKRPLVLQSSGNLLNSTKKYEVYGSK